MSDVLNFRITRATEQTISGVLSSYSYAGMGVQYDPDDPASQTLEQASGTRGFILERDVIDSTLIDNLALQFFPGRTLLRPEAKGNTVSARKVEEVIVDGVATLMVLEGTGALDDETAATTELSFYNGRWREKQEGEEVAGIVRGQATPNNPDNSFALLIEVL